jgi:energy-coupling factor transport system ATP-binding protein
MSLQTNSAIEFSQVSYIYPNGKRALKDISLSIKPGEVIAVVGENGAGKTTLIKHMNGLLRPTIGTVKVFGLDTRGVSVAQLSRRVGVVFQNPNHQLFAETVEEEVSFALKNFRAGEDVIKSRVEWALEFFGLTEYRATSPFTLSEGEKKRLTIAAVMAWKPDVLVLDEPTVGQDFNYREKLQQVIRQLREQGRTVVMVSHDLEFLWPLQPRTIVMARGEILADDRADRVFTDDRLLTEAHLRRPQLLELWLRLRVKPERPFTSTGETVSWIRGRRQRAGEGG